MMCCFIDEIHRLNTTVEEYLYSAMEDYRIDIMMNSGPECAQHTNHFKSFYINWCNYSLWIADSTFAGTFWHQFSFGILYYRSIEKIIKDCGSRASRAMTLRMQRLMSRSKRCSRMQRRAAESTEQPLRTGQGADFTNGHSTASTW